MLTRIAEAHGVDPARVVLRWHVQRGVVVIPRSKTPERIATNAAIEDFTLTEPELTEIDGLGARR